MSANFENTSILTRFMLRRERVNSLMWILILGGVVILLVPGMFYALPPAERFAILETLSMPAMVSMVGPAFGEYGTYGALYTNFMMAFTVLTVGLMNIFLVVRLTRADEEKGRLEVLRSLPVGRLSNLSAALITALIINILLGLFIALGMFGFGSALNDTGMCLNGSLLWGATLAVTGLVFAALTAFFSQLSSNSRSAMGYAFMTLGFFFLLRAPGDMNPDMEILALISPLGLPLRTAAYAGNYWWPILIMFAIASVVTGFAYYFQSIRDIDQGIIPAKPGRAHGSFLTKTPQSFVLKLMKTTIIVWLVSMFILGAAYGTVFGELDTFIATNEMYQQLILGPFAIEFLEGLTIDETVAAMRTAVAAAGFAIPQLFSAMINLIMGMFVTVPSVLFVMKMRKEEAEIKSELLLATPVKRSSYMSGYVIIAFVMAVLIQMATGFGMYISAAAVLYNPADFPLSFAMQAALIYVPAIWVKIGLTVLIIGLVPKATGIVWAYFAYTFLFLFFGQGFGIFPDWAAYLSPFAFVTQLPLGPGESVNFVALGIKIAIAAILTVAGFYFYKKRDINAITH